MDIHVGHLIKIADKLDSMGQYKAADKVDAFLTKIAAPINEDPTLEEIKNNPNSSNSAMLLFNVDDLLKQRYVTPNMKLSQLRASHPEQVDAIIYAYNNIKSRAPESTDTQGQAPAAPAAQGAQGAPSVLQKMTDLGQKANAYMKTEEYRRNRISQIDQELNKLKNEKAKLLGPGGADYLKQDETIKYMKAHPQTPAPATPPEPASAPLATSGRTSPI